jgi:hypothetical protein
VSEVPAVKRYFHSIHAPHNLAEARHDPGDDEYVLASDYDELTERFEACFKQKEYAEHKWGVAQARIRELEVAIAEAELAIACGGPLILVLGRVEDALGRAKLGQKP